MNRRASLLLATLAATVLAAASTEAQQNPGPHATSGIRTTTIVGRLVGSDGKPMRHAHVSIALYEASRMLTTVEAAPDGAFSITTKRLGAFHLFLSGVDHFSKDVPLLLGASDTIVVNVRLGTHRFDTPDDSVCVIGDFNGFAFNRAMPMMKRLDGTYIFTTRTRYKSIGYQLVFRGPIDGKIAPFGVNGTNDTTVVWDGNSNYHRPGDYRSLVKVVDSIATIVYDPRRRPASDLPDSIAFGNPTDAALSGILAEMTLRFDVSAADTTFTHDWNADAERLLRALRDEHNPVVRQALMLSYIDMQWYLASPFDSSIARLALEEIPPTSPLWSVDRRAAAAAIRLAAPDDKGDGYLNAILADQPDSLVKLVTLTELLARCSYADNGEHYERYYTELSERFGNHHDAVRDRKKFAPDNPIGIGKPVPPFAIASLDDSSSIISNETLLGKYYLIDFWATWCGPCLGEMPHLHRICDKYRGKHFEIVSIALEDSTGPVIRMRAYRWKMPWLNAVATNEFRSDIVKAFDVTRVPTPLLIDPRGTIIATAPSLSGAALDATLARVLGDYPRAGDGPPEK